MKSALRVFGFSLALVAAASASAWSEETRYGDCHRACPGPNPSQVAYQITYDECCAGDQSFFYPCTRTGFIEWIGNEGYFSVCPSDDPGYVDCHITCPNSSASRINYQVPYDQCCGLDESFFYPCTRTGYKWLNHVGYFKTCQ